MAETRQHEIPKLPELRTPKEPYALAPASAYGYTLEQDGNVTRIEVPMSQRVEDLLGSTSGRAIAQAFTHMRQMQQRDRAINIEVQGVEGITEETTFPPLFLTKKQVNAIKASGYLDPVHVANHLCRVDTPDGLSESARWLINTAFVAGEPTAELTRTVSFLGVRGKVAPAPKTGPAGIPFDHTVEVLKAMNQVRQALDIQGDITEEELREGQAAMLKGVSPAGLVNASVFDRAFNAAQSPKKAASLPSQAELIRRYIDAKVAKAVEENTPHIPKNVVDANTLSQVDQIANRIGRAHTMCWPDVDERTKAEVQQQAWDEWAEMRAMHLASERNLQQRREQELQQQEAREQQRALAEKTKAQEARAVVKTVGEWERYEPKGDFVSWVDQRFRELGEMTVSADHITGRDEDAKAPVEEEPAITPDEWLKMPF